MADFKPINNRLARLIDVSVAGITDGQTLSWNAATAKFLAATISGGGGNITAGSASNQTLHWNGTAYVPSSLMLTDGNTIAINGALDSTAFFKIMGGGNAVNPLQINHTFVDADFTGASGNFPDLAGINLSLTHEATTINNPFDLIWTGIRSDIIVGPTKNVLGTLQCFTATADIINNSNMNSEYAPFMGWIRSAIPSRVWFADFSAFGGTNQMNLLNGVTMHMASGASTPTNGPAGAFWAVSTDGGGGGTAGVFQSMTRQTIDVGVGVVGSVQGGTVAGFATAFKSGGFGSGWMPGGRSRINTGLRLEDIDTCAIDIRNAYSPAATRILWENETFIQRTAIKLLETNADVEIDDATKGIILRDSSATRYRVTVNTSGTLVITSLGGGGGVVVGTYSDTFTRADSAISMGNFEVPASPPTAWSIQGAQSASVTRTAGIISNKGYFPSGQVQPCALTPNIGNINATVQADITFRNGQVQALIGGVVGGSNDRYYLRLESTTVVAIRTFIGNTEVQVAANTGMSLVDGTVYTVKLIRSGNTLTGYINGIQACTVSVSTALPAGQIFGYGVFTTANGTETFDNFSVTTP